jgi:fucose permease
MRRVRHIDPTTAGLSSSIFWGGMALGRYSLGPVSDRFGVHITVAVYIVIAIFFQIGLGIVEDATATLIILGLNGFMVAPLYPSGVVVLVSRLPLRSQLTAVAVAMGLGQGKLSVGYDTRLRHLLIIPNNFSGSCCCSSWSRLHGYETRHAASD